MPDQKRNTKGRVNALDKTIGARVRKLRMVRGLSQEKLAEQLGITFQQVQKYEQGSNRISVSRLVHISKALKSPIAYFFDNLDTSVPVTGFAEQTQDEFDPTGNKENLFETKETLELLKTYYSIEDKQARKDLLKIVRTFANNIKSD
jgi:transcriptional regulator with XRE-family HTH domain